jgi:hypothetical protein
VLVPPAGGGDGSGGTPSPTPPQPSRGPDELGVDDPIRPVSDSIGLGLDAISLLDDPYEWLVPLFVVSIPGFIVVLAILGQSLVGALWLVPARRTLGNRRGGSTGRSVRRAARG